MLRGGFIPSRRVVCRCGIPSSVFRAVEALVACELMVQFLKVIAVARLSNVALSTKTPDTMTLMCEPLLKENADK